MPKKSGTRSNKTEERINEYLKKTNLSQADLARKVTKDPIEFNKIVKGRNLFTDDLAMSVAKVFASLGERVSPSYLQGRNDDHTLYESADFVKLKNKNEAFSDFIKSIGINFVSNTDSFSGPDCVSIIVNGEEKGKVTSSDFVTYRMALEKAAHNILETILITAANQQAWHTESKKK